MLERSAILTEARSWIGTPWVHQGHLKGVAADCVGLVVETLRAVGFPLEAFSYPSYGRRPVRGSLEAMVARFLEPIPLADIKPADIVLVCWRTTPMHIAFVGNYLHREIRAPLSAIHAMLDVGKVSEHILTDEGLSHLSSAWRVPGVQ